MLANLTLFAPMEPEICRYQLHTFRLQIIGAECRDLRETVLPKRRVQTVFSSLCHRIVSFKTHFEEGTFEMAVN